jgi:hypothetical protein
MFLARARQEIVASAQLDATDSYGSGKNYNFLGAFMCMAWKSRTLDQSNNG